MYFKDVEQDIPVPHYLIEGTIFGEQDMIFNRITQERFTAMDDCFVLQVKKPLFKSLIEEFEDFRDEVFAIAKEREKEAIKCIQREETGVKLEEDFHIDKEDYKLYKAQLNELIAE
jgi:signal-transduction protein with cAMP-binding, CBS, and nucleotidyltransferase domain